MTPPLELPALQTEIVPLASLRPHPRNYVQHPADEIAHIIESIKEHGLYRNIVIARDGTILAGHGVAQAARQLGLVEIPVRRLDVAPDDPRALKVITGDNEIAHLREVDDRALSEILKEIKEVDITGLLGTGYDEMMLANLAMVTRPASEIADFNEAAEWVGMPEYDYAPEPLKIVVSFADAADRQDFLQRLGLTLTEKAKSTWWPPRDRDDIASVRFEGHAA